MPTQTSYSSQHAVAYAGLIASGVPSEVVSRTNNNATAIAFGTPVDFGAGDNECKVHAATGVVVGIAVRDPSLPPNNTDTFKQYDDVTILRAGEIWVTAAVAVNEGDPVYYVDADGTWTNVSGAGANIALGTSRYLTAAGIGALAKISVKL